MVGELTLPAAQLLSAAALNYAGHRCVCQVEVSQPLDVGLLRLLELQLERCGPANLTQPSAAHCAPPGC